VAGKERFTITNPDAPKAALLAKDPSDIHVTDAEFINEQVGAKVVTPRQVQVCKVLLMAAQAARREDAPAPKATKATPKETPKAAGRAKASGKPPAAKKAATAKGRQRAARGSQAAASTAPAEAPEPSADAPF
jgi:hypothetical protein